MKYTTEQINEIIGLKGNDGKLIDIFDLHGILYVGNTKNGEWDLSKTYTKYSEHSLGFSIEDFEYCKTIDDIKEVFILSLRVSVWNKIL